VHAPGSMPRSARLSLLALGALSLALAGTWAVGGREGGAQALRGPEPGAAEEGGPGRALPAAGEGRRALPVDLPTGADGGPEDRTPGDGAAQAAATQGAPGDDPRPGNRTPERRAAVERQLRLHAGRMATRLGLASGAEERIVAVLLEANDRAEAILSDYAGRERTLENRRAMRAALDEVPRWQHARFVELFGEEAARGILEHDDVAAAREEGIPLIEDGD